MSAVKIPGKEVQLGGKLFVLAPLNAATAKQYREQIKAVFVGAMPDIELVSALAHASLQRNYPEITAEEVDEFIDFGNLFEVWENLLNVSGLVVQAGNMVRRVQEQAANLG